MKPRSPERVLQELGLRIAEVRTARDLTQEALAERLDVGVRYVQAVESGAQNVTIRTLTAFANQLRVPPRVLFERPRVRRRRPGRPRKREP